MTAVTPKDTNQKFKIVFQHPNRESLNRAFSFVSHNYQNLIHQYQQEECRKKYHFESNSYKVVSYVTMIYIRYIIKNERKKKVYIRYTLYKEYSFP